MTSSDVEAAPIYSELATDPDLAELVEMFVDEMDGRIGAFRTAFEAGEFEQLRSLAHQLKGAAGSYGFAELTPASYELECAAKAAQSVDQIREKLEYLECLCSRTKAGVPH